MDFGSSHVYAGGPYYADVPSENTEPQPASPTKQREAIYESVNEVHHKNNQDNPNHSYDPVYVDSGNNESRTYDLVPYEPELDTTNAEESNSQSAKAKPARLKKGLSSTVLHKAKKITHWKNKNKASKSTSSSDLDLPGSSVQQSRRTQPLPPVPVRTTKARDPNKPLPPLPANSTPDSSKPTISPIPSSLKLHQSTSEAEPDVFSDTPEESWALSEPLKPTKATDATPALYPALPNVYADVNRNYNVVKTASAPPMDSTVMSSFDLISFEEPVFCETQSAFKETDLLATAQQTAPVLSASMVKRDTRAKNKTENPYAIADTNVVSVKLGILQNVENSMVWAMPPAHCVQCNAVLLHQAISEKQQESSAACRFCGSSHAKVDDAVLPLVGSESDITYVLSQDAPVTTDDPIIIFCVDTSGSMCVSSKMRDTGLFMSRLQGVQDGIICQLNKLLQTRPKARVAVVTFSDMVVVYGDGSPEQYVALDDAQLYDTDFLKSLAGNVGLPDFIENTHKQLTKTVNMFKDHGGTALGPALFLSVALASRKQGSQVIVCTDGRANVGIGSLELERDYKVCHYFYKETSEYGTKMGTVVSILSIEGTDCRLVELGKVANQTAGKVKIANVQYIAQEFDDILSSSLMATQVDVNIVTQKDLYFQESATGSKSSISSFVGNATQDTEIAFKYGIRESDDKQAPQNALFQLQVKYSLYNGCTCLRVITQSRPVTENRMLAEQSLNAAVVGTYASQLASKLFLDGDLRDAKLTTDAHKRLINRALSIRSTRGVTANEEDERIYGSVRDHIEELNKEIDDVVKSVQPTTSPTPSSDAPPPLPPRLPETPKSLSPSPSLSSLSLPEVPSTPLATREKLKDAVEHCPDEVARKLYKHRNACGKMFYAC